jgi:hypothetical protein
MIWECEEEVKDIPFWERDIQEMLILKLMPTCCTNGKLSDACPTPASIPAPALAPPPALAPDDLAEYQSEIFSYSVLPYFRSLLRIGNIFLNWFSNLPVLLQPDSKSAKLRQSNPTRIWLVDSCVFSIGFPSLNCSRIVDEANWSRKHFPIWRLSKWGPEFNSC